MAYIKEEIKHKYLDVKISVLELEKYEKDTDDPYRIINFDSDNMKDYTPDELVDLGNWLINNANRIKKQYTSTGKVRKSLAHG